MFLFHRTEVVVICKFAFYLCSLGSIQLSVPESGEVNMAECLFGIQFKDFVLIAADTVTAFSIIALHQGNIFQRANSTQK